MEAKGLCCYQLAKFWHHRVAACLPSFCDFSGICKQMTVLFPSVFVLCRATAHRFLFISLEIFYLSQPSAHCALLFSAVFFFKHLHEVFYSFVSFKFSIFNFKSFEKD
jgi:hypothetical protein